ncbi:hypothetical protein MAIT1_02810 [Magnetofaba australis IT-1]|uniref:STAS domain-containing protein n=2 Tax=Magnetofaba TaxID=1472292 RepID=W0LJD3_9PROT|nr:hypothetical protein MIIT1_02810 [Magnetofaba australis IT-1]OSM08648.1 hypothetical protein MAIT1_02810 [Magnetofaba australis IT-1]
MTLSEFSKCEKQLKEHTDVETVLVSLSLNVGLDSTIIGLLLVIYEIFKSAKLLSVELSSPEQLHVLKMAQLDTLFELK